ncbi:hypothetical protein [Microbulbifer sp. GL-2]|uniref:hypothetical protein n=1 Tax=Microbulbifer sp. GL-2 TaxID=2591606 RepID=UPI0011652CD0|nr:hypothetical protein [Microbulbifer sp. GL-2]BBM02888.1 hypothetical protein GL2_29620 [Microbulbifer sp. GL-2]
MEIETSSEGSNSGNSDSWNDGRLEDVDSRSEDAVVWIVNTTSEHVPFIYENNNNKQILVNV